MKLHIDTSNREKLVIKLNDEIYEEPALQSKSQYLLPLIESKLKEKNKAFKDITEITVATGPGSFTGLRVGVSIAQTLGWALHVPVNGQLMTEKKYIDIQY